MATSTVDTVLADGLRLAYRELGSGAPVLLLHGWPTSSHLWRNVMPAIAGANRVVALDLPGFGASDKPLGVRYNFEFYARILDGFLTAIGVDEVAIAGHDLGGPIALHWALSPTGAGRRARAAEHGRVSRVLPVGDRVRYGLPHPGTARATHQSRGPDGTHAHRRG